MHNCDWFVFCLQPPNSGILGELFSNVDGAGTIPTDSRLGAAMDYSWTLEFAKSNGNGLSQSTFNVPLLDTTFNIPMCMNTSLTLNYM